jgi:hypothetical protein
MISSPQTFVFDIYKKALQVSCAGGGGNAVDFV